MDLNLDDLEVYTTPELERAHSKLGKVLEKRAGGELKQIRKRVQKLADSLGMEITVKAESTLKPKPEAPEAEEELPEATPVAQATEEIAAAEEAPPPPKKEVAEIAPPAKRKSTSKRARRYPLKPRRVS